MAAKNPFGAVAPPPRKGRTGSGVDPETVAALNEALTTAFESDGEPWIGDGETYKTKGAATGTAAKLKRALVAHGHIGEIREVRSRVWESNGGFQMALAFRAAEEEEGEE